MSRIVNQPSQLPAKVELTLVEGAISTEDQLREIGFESVCGFVYERPEQALRKQIFLPAKLRMPLDRDDKSIRPRVFQCFHNTVCGPRGRDEIGANRLNCLVVMTVNYCIHRAGDV